MTQQTAENALRDLCRAGQHRAGLEDARELIARARIVRHHREMARALERMSALEETGERETLAAETGEEVPEQPSEQMAIAA